VSVCVEKDRDIERKQEDFGEEKDKGKTKREVRAERHGKRKEGKEE
jgi:hypothetical protein